MFNWLYNTLLNGVQGDIIDTEVVPNSTVKNSHHKRPVVGIDENCKSKEDISTKRFTAHSRKKSVWKKLNGFKIVDNKLFYYEIDFATSEEAELFAQDYSRSEKDAKNLVKEIRKEREEIEKEERIAYRKNVKENNEDIEFANMMERGEKIFADKHCW